MQGEHNFEHLPLLLTSTGSALLPRGGSTAPQTTANRAERQSHSAYVLESAGRLSADWKACQARRASQQLPVIPEGLPILLQVDPNFEIDELRARFDFEIVAEQEDGFVIVAAHDIELSLFLKLATDFASEVRGSASVASIHRLFDDPAQTSRLRQILSDRLMEQWPALPEDQLLIVDIGIACAGVQEIPALPKRGKRDDDASWAKKMSAWSQARMAAYDAWDALKLEREAQILDFVRFYNADLLRMVDGAGFLPDSFTVRLRVSGKGLKDFVLNYPFVFEVVEPEEISLPHGSDASKDEAESQVTPISPPADAPAVCVIDSGVQEGHVLLEPAIDQAASHCFLPGKDPKDVADEVKPGGHGTRVAGSVLYGEEIPKTGSPQLEFWIQNARVLNESCGMPVELFPPEAIRSAIERGNDGPRATRIFNHSINARACCRTRYMSAWAAEIDHICYERDVLVVQSAGNLPISGHVTSPGLQEHLHAGREYPNYLTERSSRVANPGQSLQALTVGSIAYGEAVVNDYRTFATVQGHPSAFSRGGAAIWNVIKPEVVEYGGDAVRNSNDPPDIAAGAIIPEACPETVRSTLYPPGPATDRDAVGTSYAAPKVARLAAHLQGMFPDESALLYRALVVQSARWPDWAESVLNRLRRPAGMDEAEKSNLRRKASEAIRCIGYGKPDLGRASENTEFRTTLITAGETEIHAGECHIYQVPIPTELRGQADEFDIRIDVTLSYVAEPRRTRRNLRRYLATWVDWKTSKLGEGLDDFHKRAMKDVDDGDESIPGEVLPWTLHENPKWGVIRDFRRNCGTVQKDWAIVNSNSLPEHFCIAVVGHRGWSHDPDARARYAMAVSFEALGQEISIYEPLRTAVLELQAELEAETEAEVSEEDLFR